MKGSVFPGDTMSLTGVVESTSVDDVGCGFVTVAVTLSVDGEVKTTCAARIALPGAWTTTPGPAGATSGARRRDRVLCPRVCLVSLCPRAEERF